MNLTSCFPRVKRNEKIIPNPERVGFGTGRSGSNRELGGGSVGSDLFHIGYRKLA
jgi:hypothetical protein